MREIRSSGSVEGVMSNRDPYSDNSSMKRSGLLNQFLGVLLHTMACSELARVRTELS